MELQEYDENLDPNFEIIMEQYMASMMALQYQDFNASEKSLRIAKGAYRNIEIQVTPAIAQEEGVQEYLKTTKLFVDFIEVITKMLKSNFLIIEERFTKAKSEGEHAMELCINAKENLAKVMSLDDEFGLGEFTDIFIFLLDYLQITLSGQQISVRAQIDKKEGVFVDEIELNKRLIKEYRKINELNINPNNPEIYQMELGLISLLNKIADTQEKKLERLIENRKRITYLPPIDKKIFLIHGHGMGYVREFKELMMDRLGIEPIILFEQPDNGKTIIEKIEEYGKDCAFAFSILTPDDWVENNGKKYFQARPNVIYELGWFSGRYGRNKVRIIKKDGTDMPSDLSGLITINFTNTISEVFLKIEKELIAAGLVKKN